jgi:cyclopropane-fatty-acyl-phospholipid synthase
MSVAVAAAWLTERVPLPDIVTRTGIQYLVSRTRRKLAALDAAPDDASFAAGMGTRPIAEFTRDANRQHYELPPEFFALVLGPRRKYSCCFYADGAETLAAAEERALDETARHAGLVDGQSILELGCGWGSLSLWMAARFPHSHITAVSNSRPLRLFMLYGV